MTEDPGNATTPFHPLKTGKNKNKIIGKTLLWCAVLLAVLSTIALSGNESGNQDDKYCGKLKDGIIKVMYQGSPISTDVTLENGTVIKTDGTVIKKNGSKTTLKDGECIGEDGALIPKENTTSKK
jgi:hypothetical protein